MPDHLPPLWSCRWPKRSLHPQPEARPRPRLQRRGSAEHRPTHRPCSIYMRAAAAGAASGTGCSWRRGMLRHQPCSHGPASCTRPWQKPLPQLGLLRDTDWLPPLPMMQSGTPSVLQTLPQPLTPQGRWPAECRGLPTSSLGLWSLVGFIRASSNAPWARLSQLQNSIRTQDPSTASLCGMHMGHARGKMPGLPTSQRILAEELHLRHQHPNVGNQIAGHLQKHGAALCVLGCNGLMPVEGSVTSSVPCNHVPDNCALFFLECS